MDISDRIGISTISLSGATIEEAIKAVTKAGFKAIELFLGVNCNGGSIGYPKRIVPVPTIWPMTFNKKQRKKLKKMLDPFLHVTTHVQIADVNISSSNPGIREESIRQYLRCVEFTHDIGVSLVTFHAGNPGRYPWYAKSSKDEVDKWNIEFIEKALEYDKKQGFNLLMGFEGTHGAGVPIIDIISKVRNKRFGILIDPTQSYVSLGRSGGNVDPVIDAIYNYKDRIYETHVHGGLCRTVGFAAHLPLRFNNVVDWKKVLSALKDIKFKGPFMFEITSSDNYRTVIQDCQESKELLVKWYKEA